MLERPPSARLRAGDRRATPARASRAATPTAGDRVGQPVIRVVGVGGAGVNAVNRMVEAEVEGVEFLAVNTDLQSLQQSTADVTLHIGARAHARAGLRLGRRTSAVRRRWRTTTASRRC